MDSETPQAAHAPHIFTFLALVPSFLGLSEVLGRGPQNHFFLLCRSSQYFSTPSPVLSLSPQPQGL